MINLACPVCGNEKCNETIKTNEMMFGSNDEFIYQECSLCGTLTLLNVPPDMSKYYPQDYYSFTKVKGYNPLVDFLRRKRMESLLLNASLFGTALQKILPVPNHHLWIRNVDIGYDSRILDVGCGSGYFLHILRLEGFRSLVGIDPYIAETTKKDGICLIKGEICDLDKQRFDIVLFNHSLEHMLEPANSLSDAGTILAEGGHCIVATPVSDSYAYKKYGRHWVGLDSPRHLQVFSRKGMKACAIGAGFIIKSIIEVSKADQFWASEQYVNGIPLFSESSYAVNQSKSMFSRNDIKRYKRMSKVLNLQRLGDQAIFIMCRSIADPVSLDTDLG